MAIKTLSEIQAERRELAIQAYDLMRQRDNAQTALDAVTVRVRDLDAYIEGHSYGEKAAQAASPAEIEST